MAPAARVLAIQSSSAGRWVEQYGLGLGVITLGPGVVEQLVELVVNITRAPGFPTKVVDPVGAGDTFMAGFLDGYVSSSSG